MSKLLKFLAAISGITITVVTGIYLLLNQSNTSIKEAFKNAIIDFEKEKDLVYSKLKKLKAAKDISNKSRFKSAFDNENKAQNSGFNELKKACEVIYKSVFVERESELFDDFQKYYARTNKDKIGEQNWAQENANWKTRFENLKKNEKTPLSEKLKRISVLNIVDGSPLKEWCSEIEGFVFENEENLIFRDAKASCGKED